MFPLPPEQEVELSEQLVTADWKQTHILKHCFELNLFCQQVLWNFMKTRNIFNKLDQPNIFALNQPNIFLFF